MAGPGEKPDNTPRLDEEEALNAEASRHLPDELGFDEDRESEAAALRARQEAELVGHATRGETRRNLTVFDTHRQEDDLRSELPDTPPSSGGENEKPGNGQRFADAASMITDTAADQIEHKAAEYEAPARSLARETAELREKYGDEEQYGTMGKAVTDISKRAESIAGSLEDVQNIQREAVAEDADWWEKALAKVVDAFQYIATLWKGFFGSTEEEETADAESPDEADEAEPKFIDGMTFTKAFGIDGQVKLTSIFGNRHLFDRTRHHNGLDIAAAKGTPIKAKEVLTVVDTIPEKNAAGKVNAGGNVVIVKDPSGNFHSFCHLESLPSLREGQVIQPGEEVGRIGSTGRSTGPHLHWVFSTKGPRRGDAEDPATAVTSSELMGHIAHKRRTQQAGVDEHDHGAAAARSGGQTAPANPTGGVAAAEPDQVPAPDPVAAPEAPSNALPANWGELVSKGEVSNGTFNFEYAGDSVSLNVSNRTIEYAGRRGQLELPMGAQLDTVQATESGGFKMSAKLGFMSKEVEVSRDKFAGYLAQIKTANQGDEIDMGNDVTLKIQSVS